MKAIKFLSLLLVYLATGVLVLMMLLTVGGVFMCYFFNSPIAGTTEITELMLILLVFPALAWCAVSGHHLKVDYMALI